MDTTSRKKGAISREKIIAAAYPLFLKQGYHATTIRQIAQQAGLTMGGIYAHFENKEAIWMAVLIEKHPFHDILPAIEAARGETAAPLMRDAAHRMVASIGAKEDLLNLMFIEFVEFNGQHFQNLIPTLIPQFAQVGQRFSQMQGSLRPLPPLEIVRSFFGLFFSYFMTEMILGSQAKLLFTPQTLDHFVDIYLYGILAENDPSRNAHV
jgi:AcrR family transcriptional regulator